MYTHVTRRQHHAWLPVIYSVDGFGLFLGMQQIRGDWFARNPDLSLDSRKGNRRWTHRIRKTESAVGYRTWIHDCFQKPYIVVLGLSVLQPVFDRYSYFFYCFAVLSTKTLRLRCHTICILKLHLTRNSRQQDLDPGLNGSIGMGHVHSLPSYQLCNAVILGLCLLRTIVCIPNFWEFQYVWPLTQDSDWKQMERKKEDWLLFNYYNFFITTRKSANEWKQRSKMTARHSYLKA